MIQVGHLQYSPHVFPVCHDLHKCRQNYGLQVPWVNRCPQWCACQRERCSGDEGHLQYAPHSFAPCHGQWKCRQNYASEWRESLQLSLEEGRDQLPEYAVEAGGAVTDKRVGDQGLAADFLPETAAEKVQREARLAKDAASAKEQWLRRARDGLWDGVVAPMEVYRVLAEVKENPRLTTEYRDAVLQGLGLVDPKADPKDRRRGALAKFSHLTDHDLEALVWFFHRKAPALWLKETPRTTVRGLVHHTVVTTGPVRSHPIHLKGEQKLFTEESLEAEVKLGTLSRGNSAWGSYAFPTAPHPTRRRRVVGDYRRINKSLARAVYFIRHCTDLKREAMASIWYTVLDAVRGFNQIENSPLAREVLALLTSAGCYLANVLQLGPWNGPEDFAYAVDRLCARSKDHQRKLAKEWLIYIDDFLVRTGRWRHLSHLPQAFESGGGGRHLRGVGLRSGGVSGDARTQHRHVFPGADLGHRPWP